MPPYRTGDVLSVTMFRSLSEGKFNKFTGVVMGQKRPNSLGKSFKIHFSESDVNMSMMVKAYSPMVAKVEMYKYGSN